MSLERGLFILVLFLVWSVRDLKEFEGWGEVVEGGIEIGICILMFFEELV